MSPGDFRCTEHAQCVIGNVAGYCEANGRCSVSDEKGCPTSLRRYAHRAGADSDACVPPSCEGNPITLVSAGGGHACLARKEDGSLWCWGRNDHGQIGDGTRTPRALPVRVPGISHPQALAAGDAHTCVAESGGRVLCWGADDTGQLADGGGPDRGLPREVPGISNVKALAAGKDFTCALSEDGVRCWGDDSVGQLGDGGSPEPARLPAIVAGLSANVTTLSATWQHVCVIDAAKKLTCWGANASGQIGDDTTIGPRLPTTPNAPLPAVVTAVAAGHDHTCALAEGDLYCWGDNSQGQVMKDSPSVPVKTPVSVTGLDLLDPIQVAAGGQYTCIVRRGAGDATSGGPVTCWGTNTRDQRGGDTPIQNATLLAAGTASACALAGDGALFCWGDNHYGQLAIGGDVVRPTAAPIPGLTHVGALAAGGAHTCATADDAGGARALFCWGANGSSQLGDLSSADAPAPTRISSFAPIGIAADRAHTCAFAADRELRCWGSGASGQLGEPAGMDMVVTAPAITDLGGPEGGDGVFAVAAGAAHTCVGATISASILCFGLNSDGQLGTQISPGGSEPVASLLAMPTALAAGDAHTCALADGTVWCWGRGDEGQLGDNTVNGHVTPATVALGNGATTADAVVAGAAHTCALAGGKIVCWGRNAEGQVGTPLQMPILAPTVVNGVAQAAAVAAGAHHTCAIGSDATVSCWGANESGQLGNGKIDSSNLPVPVVGLTNVDAIVAGGSHSCARRVDGSVWCWGANTSGQLGDGATLASQRPLLARAACD
ncbi:MAG TPA: RCC1 repeat-containing protein [Polyangia bacterium]|nr:RCC1 repeat-containing protein [Polyangia bacterium]